MLYKKSLAIAVDIPRKKKKSKKNKKKALKNTGKRHKKQWESKHPRREGVKTQSRNPMRSHCNIRWWYITKEVLYHQDLKLLHSHFSRARMWIDIF